MLHCKTDPHGSKDFEPDGKGGESEVDVESYSETRLRELATLVEKLIERCKKIEEICTDIARGRVDVTAKPKKESGEEMAIRTRAEDEGGVQWWCCAQGSWGEGADEEGQWMENGRTVMFKMRAVGVHFDGWDRES
eukprot:TRINITY_DN126170_c0_g1_i1.p1 TRINITY_DN126170_c0_g1~~TRINITY_DN126170_c0_g1_i1.p1  ORF type:complete len:136 (+),score=24.31 TRINITY_DN126170_c0_g1_i1:36-443(+)